MTTLPGAVAGAHAVLSAFAYQAETRDGHNLSGTIDCADQAEALRRLESLGLRVVKIGPAPVAQRPRAIRGEDFIALNQQLAQLTAAGLPIEHGLRLIAQDMRSGRLAQTVRLIADELDRGTPLAEAFEKYHTKFPSLYGRLIEAGVRTNNLPAMLLNLGRHLELVQRLRGTLWRVAAYPLMVLTGLMIILGFLSVFVLPPFKNIFTDFGTELPSITKALIWVGDELPGILLLVIAAIILLPVVWMILRMLRWDRAVIDHVVLPTPLIGPILKWNMIARWCDAARLGVDAGMDLPAVVDLAGNAVASPFLISDGSDLVHALQSTTLPQHGLRMRLLPATVSGAIGMATRQEQLSITLEMLCRMYQEQAEMRLAVIPAILTPLLLILLSLTIGFVILGLFAPLVSIIQTIGF